jgi:hypothetical protein
MPSRVYFTAPAGEKALSIRVRESPDQVARARASASGPAFRLTQHPTGRMLYVNPLAIAYWIDSPEPRQQPQPRAALRR